MRAVPTGSTEFIGKYLSARLLRDGWDVIGIDAIRLYYDTLADVPDSFGHTFAWYVHESDVETQRAFEAVVAEDLAVGRFDQRLLAQLASWLANFAYVREVQEVSAHVLQRERDRWDRCLDAHTTDLVAKLDTAAGNASVIDVDDGSGVGNRLVDDLCRLRASSERELVRGFCNLDLRVGDVRVSPAVEGRTDVDAERSFGDPALDLGVVLGSLLRVGIQRGVPARCQLSVHEVTRAYREMAPDGWAASAARTVAFAGATMLRDASNTDAKIRIAASTLLAIDHDAPASTALDCLYSVLESAPVRDRQPQPQTGRRRVSRWSLRTESDEEFIEGSVATVGVASEIVVDVAGGRPFETLGIFVDDSLIRTMTLGNDGAASQVCEVDEAVQSIELRRGSVTVLSTTKRAGLD